MDVEFEWDAEKARRNLAKHRVSFETAREVFLDPFMVITEDSDVRGETRYRVLGHSGNGLCLLLVVFVDRSSDDREIIRIISAREADQYEHSAYADQFA